MIHFAVRRKCNEFSEEPPDSIINADVQIYIHVTVHRNKFLFNNQPEAIIIQIYSVIKLYMFRASSLPNIGSFLLYIQHW